MIKQISSLAILIVTLNATVQSVLRWKQVCVAVEMSGQRRRCRMVEGVTFVGYVVL